MSESNQLKHVINPGKGLLYVSFNGIDITDQCTITPDNKIIYPNWICKELNESMRLEEKRKNKPINKFLRLIGLYKPKYGISSITVNKKI